MKYKIAICKIHMIGSPVLILGLCHYDDDDEFWEKYQMFTGEEYINCQYTYSSPGDYCYCVFENQEQADKESAKMRKWAQSHSKFHGDSVHFASINKDVKVSRKTPHDFNFNDAEAVELTKEEVKLLRVELAGRVNGNDYTSTHAWEMFDWETWGK